MRRFTFLLLLAGIAIVGIFMACHKNTEDQTNLTIRLTDNPFNASEVNVDILQVRVNIREDSTGWINVNTSTGIYNLLKLQNGIDTVLANGMVPTGPLKELRFILGDRNSIKIGNNTYPLTIPSGSESGLKIKVNKKLNAGLDSLVVDFDAALSIIQTGNGEYKLKPVLKIK
jgi:hypothetical protein